MSLLENINVNEILVWSDIFPYVQSLTILIQRIKKKVSYTQTWNDETC